MYWDANNSYGWAMAQYLPYDGFEWVSEFDKINFNLIGVDSYVGYILEVDLEYPDDLYD